MSGQDWTFVSIASWPVGWGERERHAALVKAGMPAPDAVGVSRRTAPMVIKRLPRASGESLIRGLAAQGVEAFGLSRDEMDRPVAPTPAKCLRAALGSPKPMYLVESWRESVFPNVTLMMDQVFLIIRATVTVQVTRTVIEPDEPDRMLGIGFPGDVLASGVAGSIGRLAYRAAADESELIHKSSSTRSSGDQVIEMYLMDGSRVRINSAQFNFDVLGNAKGMTDRENMDTLMLRLSEEATHAMIEFGFEAFRPPSELRLSASEMYGTNTTVKVVDPWPAFEFYSVWRYVMARQQAGLA
ncbi:MAG: hypothetical protein KGS45_13715 [Planctomycetes bacterium]|nr:hypothetical protein [Planctomycetota bacterium]